MNVTICLKEMPDVFIVHKGASDIGVHGGFYFVKVGMSTYRYPAMDISSIIEEQVAV